jgi:hypothetical protein
VYGYRFVALVSGYARKFSIIPLMVNIGSGLGLLSVATVLIDILVLFSFIVFDGIGLRVLDLLRCAQEGQVSRCEVQQPGRRSIR